MIDFLRTILLVAVAALVIWGGFILLFALLHLATDKLLKVFARTSLWNNLPDTVRRVIVKISFYVTVGLTFGCFVFIGSFFDSKTVNWGVADRISFAGNIFAIALIGAAIRDFIKPSWDSLMGRQKDT